MKVFGILGLLIALLYIAFLSTDQSKKAVLQKEQATEQIEAAQQQVEESMQKHLEQLEQLNNQQPENK